VESSYSSSSVRINTHEKRCGNYCMDGCYATVWPNNLSKGKRNICMETVILVVELVEVL